MTNGVQQIPMDPRLGFTSASNAAADALCPGRFFAQRGLPETAREDADTGKRIHLALYKGSPDGLTLAEQETYDRCQEVERNLVVKLFGADKPQEFRELRMWGRVNHQGTGLQHSGQADKIYRLGTQALILDYKALMGDVADSPKNMQLRDLAVLCRGHFLVITEVVTAIIQPLVTMTPELCLYGPQDLGLAEQAMWQRVWNSSHPNAPRTAGAQQCKFCLAKRSCPEYAAFAGSQLPVAPSDLWTVAMMNWTPEQRVRAAECLGPAVKILDDIKEFLKAGLTNDPQFIPGWELSKGRQRETIVNPQVCFDRFNALGGDLKSFMGCVTVGKTKLKEAISAATGAKGKALQAKLDGITEGIVEVKTDSPTLKKKEAA